MSDDKVPKYRLNQGYQLKKSFSNRGVWRENGFQVVLPKIDGQEHLI